MQQSLVDDRYALIGPLGSGGMANVYLARDEVLGREVALKALREQYVENEELVERFRREARAAASLSHPNIVQVFDWGRAGGGDYYISMEYVPGGTLKQRIADAGPLSAREALEVCLQISSALEEAHGRGIVHRDIKPQNVLVARDGSMKVADFGIARAASATEISTSLVLGTANYMAPEQAMGDSVGPQSDLYSLGVVVYEMLTGEPPYGGESAVAVATQHVNEPPRHPIEANPAVPKDLDALAVKLMQKRPEDRYASASALSEDLRRVRDGLSPLSVASDQTTGVASPVVVRRPNRRRGVAAILAALLVLLLGAVAWGTWQNAGGGAVVGSLKDLPGEAREALEDAGRSAGATEAEIPTVEGLDRRRAEERLKDAGFGVVIVRRESSEEDVGRVLEQSAPPGERAEKGSRVVVAIGKGPSEVEVPDLVYRSRVEGQLERAGLKLGEVERTPSDTVAEGVVISQDPAERETAKRGTTVDITVSTGPEQAPAPAGTEREAPGRASSSQEGAVPATGSAQTPAPSEGSAPSEPAPEPAPTQPQEPATPVYEEPAPAEPAPAEPVYEEPVYEEPVEEPAPEEPAPAEPAPEEPVYEEPPEDDDGEEEEVYEDEGEDYDEDGDD